MGVKLKDLVVSKPITIESLRNKILVVDSMNIMYQFMATIRQMDGSPLKNSKGKVTSHLLGLFNRTTKLMGEGIKLAFVFDGEAPLLKMKERERRQEVKKDAMLRYNEAKLSDNIEDMKKFAVRSTKFDKDMINDAKRLIELLGLPVIQAPGEGEAYASKMVAKGLGYAVVSEDYDNLMFGVTKFIKGLTISQKKKQKDVLGYVKTQVSEIDLSETLNHLKITNDQLIILGILVGTDFNIGGIKGIGPQKALKLVREYGSDFDKLFESVSWDDSFDYSYKEVFKIFKEQPDVKNLNLEFNEIDEEKLMTFLVEECEFSESNVSKKIKSLEKNKIKGQQKGLGDFF
jgi:flap endonuclease-1